MRGSQYHTFSRKTCKGIIPAGAGLTGVQVNHRHKAWDHPRGCGAHQQQAQMQQAAAGSSPRVRGTLPVDANKYKVQGIIPAGAGLTPFRMRGAASARDHPRGCGAHVDDFLLFSSDLGSSPRVRGSHLDIVLDVANQGIIPAGAGLTLSLRRNGCRTGDHPRGCGAHHRLRRPHRHRLGSSPRVRGSLLPLIQTGKRMGIIPAGAGLTRPSYPEYGDQRDHPRGCGAHILCLQPTMMALGSSPRVRGSLQGLECRHHRHRIIPAGAGLTSCLSATSASPGDHPRGCGAHTKKSQYLRHSLFL